MADDASQKHIRLLDLGCQFCGSKKRVDSLGKFSLAIVGDAKGQLELRASRKDLLSGLENLNGHVEVLVHQEHIGQVENIRFLTRSKPDGLLQFNNRVVELSIGFVRLAEQIAEISSLFL